MGGWSSEEGRERGWSSEEGRVGGWSSEEREAEDAEKRTEQSKEQDYLKQRR